MRIKTHRKHKGPDALSDLSCQFVLPPATERLPTRQMFSDLLEDNLVCPMCGAEAQSGSRFRIFLTSAMSAFSVANIHAKDPRGRSYCEWTFENIHNDDAKIECIACEECHYTHKHERFISKQPPGIRIHIGRIHEKWTSVSADGKQFFISTSLVPMGLSDNDDAILLGISLKEIDDKMRINSDSVSVRPLPS